jgi:predicted PP-loop superfamily ATPase
MVLVERCEASPERLLAVCLISAVDSTSVLRNSRNLAITVTYSAYHKTRKIYKNTNSVQEKT